MTALYVWLAINAAAAITLGTLYLWTPRHLRPVAELTTEERFWEAQLTTQPDLAAYDEDFARWEANR